MHLATLWAVKTLRVYKVAGKLKCQGAPYKDVNISSPIQILPRLWPANTLKTHPCFGNFRPSKLMTGPSPREDHEARMYWCKAQNLKSRQLPA